MMIERADESIRAAQLCLATELVNSAASRAYYAMYQAAQVALENAGLARVRWSHAALQAAFAAELIHRRKMYTAILAEDLPVGLVIRQTADYGLDGTTRRAAERIVRRASAFVSAVQEGTRYGPKS
jgi:uncharacterized protein (UPF0332 family)